MSIVSTLKYIISYKKKVKEKIELIKECGSMLWENNIGLYNLNDLESEIIKEVGEGFIPGNFKITNKNVFVITIGYLSGGHTRLMENLSDMLDNECDLIITGTVDQKLKERFLKYFKKTYEIPTYNIIDLSEIYRLSDILSQYKNIILNIHPDDLCSVIAVGILKKNVKNCIHFINHADHVFSFGATVADIWYQISEYGAKIDEQRNLKGRTSFLGIPVTNIAEEKLGSTSFKYEDVRFVITAGSANKFKPHKSFSLIKKIPDILTQFSNAKFIVVGTDIVFSPWWWWVFLKYRDRMQFYKTLEFSDYISLMNKADIYLDSFPIPGGTAFVEQYLSGRRCAGFISPLQGYTPLEAVKCSIASEQLFIIENKNLDKKIDYVHSYINVKKRFLESINNRHINVMRWGDYYNWTGDTSFFVNEKIGRIPLRIIMECVKSQKLAVQVIKNHKIACLKSIAISIIRVILNKRKK